MTIPNSIMTVILIILRDPLVIDSMYARNPNVTTIFYVLIILLLKFIMYFIFFSIVFIAYKQVE